jgi:tRNA (guanine-N7-)-methyltransferase
MQRTIKSFVLRNGRISPRQQKALENSLKNYELPLGNTNIPWDLQAAFGRKADTVVEIGFGMGASLILMAQQQPLVNFIGIEVHRAGIGSLAAELDDKRITNVRIVPHDAVEIFKKHYLADNSLAGAQIFFPDPWHKKCHQKRRLIQPEFINLLVKHIKVGGFIHCVTDWPDYAVQMQTVLSAELGLQNSQVGGSFSPRPATRPITKFEQRAMQLGHRIWDLIYIRT